MHDFRQPPGEASRVTKMISWHARNWVQSGGWQLVPPRRVVQNEFLPLEPTVADRPSRHMQHLPAAKPKVMVVDDEPAIRSYAREVLQEEGYLVAEAGSMDEALLLLALDGISVALTTSSCQGLPASTWRTASMCGGRMSRSFSCPGSFYPGPVIYLPKHGSSLSRSHPISW